MEWRDEGIVIGVRRHGERGVVLDLLTREHGRHSGLARNGRAQRMQPVLQTGNTVDAVWRARLEASLGEYRVEPMTQRAGRLIESATALYGLAHVTSLIHLLPERDPHPALYETLTVVLDGLAEPDLAAPLVIRFELAILSELGFGLDLSACAVTGGQQELIYVSPKSGRAVSRKAGEAWADRLLALPNFLRDNRLDDEPDRSDLEAGFRLTGFFLDRHVYGPGDLRSQEARGAFMAAALQTASPQK
jgi:DNA repair protein RecO (recombination protein O)